MVTHTHKRKPGRPRIYEEGTRPFMPTVGIPQETYKMLEAKANQLSKQFGFRVSLGHAIAFLLKNDKKS